MVDCSRFTGRARELLFMNSRDRLRNGELKQEIERALEEMLKQHPGLRDLKERRRRQQTEAKLADYKPLEDILESLLKKSPTLANLFLKGLRASNPFKTVKVRDEEEKPFEGKRFPTFFKLKGKDYGQELVRETAINMVPHHFRDRRGKRLFGRATETGQFSLFLLNSEGALPRDGLCRPEPTEWHRHAEPPASARLRGREHPPLWAIVTDPTRIDPFENPFTVKVKPEVQPSGSTDGRRKPPDHEPGDDREVPTDIALPKIIPVEEKDWQTQTPPFDKYTALQIKNAGDGQRRERRRQADLRLLRQHGQPLPEDRDEAGAP